jgi:hypothetical protein
MVKNEVYSWRVSSGLKSAIEEAARRAGISSAQLLELAVRHWLEKRSRGTDAAAQEKLHARVRATLGTVRGGGGRADGSGELVKQKLRQRHAR